MLQFHLASHLRFMLYTYGQIFVCVDSRYCQSFELRGFQKLYFNKNKSAKSLPDTPSFVGFISIACNFCFVYCLGLHFSSIIIHFSSYSAILCRLHLSASDPQKLKRNQRLGCYLHPFMFSLHAYLSQCPHLPSPGASDKQNISLFHPYWFWNVWLEYVLTYGIKFPTLNPSSNSWYFLQLYLLLECSLVVTIVQDQFLGSGDISIRTTRLEPFEFRQISEVLYKYV